jgi:hypothetical protein
MHAHRSTETRLQEMIEQIDGYDVALALTESHFGLPGRNRCDVLATWAAGVANARVLNVHARYGDVLKIATLADFCGTRWMNSAIMIPTPRSQHTRAYMMPVARVMALYRRYSGQAACAVTAAPQGLDVTASRTGDLVYLHVVNTNRTQSIPARFDVTGERIAAARAFEIAGDPMREIDQSTPDLFAPQERVLPDRSAWQFPAASVTAVELTIGDRG